MVEFDQRNVRDGCETQHSEPHDPFTMSLRVIVSVILHGTVVHNVVQCYLGVIVSLHMCYIIVDTGRYIVQVLPTGKVQYIRYRYSYMYKCTTEVILYHTVLYVLIHTYSTVCTHTDALRRQILV